MSLPLDLRKMHMWTRCYRVLVGSTRVPYRRSADERKRAQRKRIEFLDCLLSCQVVGPSGRATGLKIPYLVD